MANRYKILATNKYPDIGATTGKIVKSDGTIWAASTETYAAPGTSGNVMTSDGTDWTSATPTSGNTTLKITYTGTPQSALVLPITMNSMAVVPVATVGGQATYTAVSGPTIATFIYTEGNATLGNVLLTLSFDDLVGVSGNFSPASLASLTSLSCPTLVSVGGTFNPATMASVTTLDFSSLAYVSGTFNSSSMAALTTYTLTNLTSVGGTFNPSSFASLTTLSCPALVTVGISFAPASMASVTTFNFPALVSVGTTFAPSAMGALTSMSCNALQIVGSNFSVGSMTLLDTLSFAGMVRYGGTISLSSGQSNLTSVVLGTIGTLKSIAGATITISGQKLTSASVNAILALLVSLDGTNGTTTWGAGKTLTINGGTNGAPTGQGITDKATLIARTATVTTN